MENSRSFNPKAEIVWQLENLKNYKNLQGKLLVRGWKAKRHFPIQILLISNVHNNPLLKNITLKI